MDEHLFIAIRGLGLGAAFTIIALSLNVIYRATHILNFAQGGMFVLGGLLGAMFSEGGYGTWSWLGGFVVSGPADRARLQKVAESVYEQIENRPQQTGAVTRPHLAQR